MAAEPFRIEIPDSKLEDLSRRLRAASLQLSGWNSPGPSRSPSPKRRSWGFGRAGGARNADSR